MTKIVRVFEREDKETVKLSKEFLLDRLGTLGNREQPDLIAAPGKGDFGKNGVWIGNLVLGEQVLCFFNGDNDGDHSIALVFVAAGELLVMSEEVIEEHHC